MFEELKGKNVCINALFASTAGNFGMTPCSYYGVVIDVKDGFIKMHVTSTGLTYDATRTGFAGLGSGMISRTEPANNIMYFNINNISYIKIL